MRDVIIRHSSLDIPRLPLTKFLESVRKSAHEGADSVRLLVRLAGSLLAPGAGRPGAVAPGLADRPPLSDRGGGFARRVGPCSRLAFSPRPAPWLSPELSLLGPFSNDFLRLFILPQTGKNRLPQMAVARPLRKAHLTHQFRLQPLTPLHLGPGQAAESTPFFRQVGERTLRAPELLEGAEERLQ